jgi:REP element-mobilizing transposase RayT
MKRRRYKIDAAISPVFVITSITGWLPVFKIKSLAEKSLNLLENIRREIDISVIAFVLMPSHFHGMFRSRNKVDLSRAMQQWKSRASRLILDCAEISQPFWLEHFKESASLYNCSNRQVHQVWTPRFASTALESEEQFYAALEYIHNNPINSQLASNLDDYPYSSHHDYAGKDNGYVKIDRALWLSRSEQALTREETPMNGFVRIP